MIDTHAHIDDQQFDADREDVIRRAFSSGVSKIITIGAGLGSSERAVKLASENDNIFAVVGLHPEYFMKHGSWGKEHKKKLEELARGFSSPESPARDSGDLGASESSSRDSDEENRLVQAGKVVAIGEIGLEYHSHDGKEITLGQKEFQKEGFIFQLEFARKLKLPVVIHCRGERAEAGMKYREKSEAYEDVMEILKDKKMVHYGSSTSIMEVELPWVVFHSFGGNLEVAKKILEFENISFSFNGNLTYAKPSAEILEVVKAIPLAKIMLETDCPYLAPVPKRGERNEPANVAYVRDAIAEIKGITSEKVDEITTENAKKFFGL